MVIPVAFMTILSMALFVGAQQHTGNNFELANKSDQSVYFSLSDKVDLFKIMLPDDQGIPHFISVPETYQRAPHRHFMGQLNIATYQGKLITLVPSQSLAALVDNTEPMQLLLARGKSPAAFDELRLYRFTPLKTLYLKVDEHYNLVPLEGKLKWTSTGFKRFARSGGSLEYNVTPEDIKLVKKVTR